MRGKESTMLAQTHTAPVEYKLELCWVNAAHAVTSHEMYMQINIQEVYIFCLRDSRSVYALLLMLYMMYIGLNILNVVGLASECCENLFMDIMCVGGSVCQLIIHT